ncbi:MAG: hypothetical protein JO309_01565 [Pseudonocardiales bacterium]|nr:hypothetical protein [Hyphomicrobiales bacterium]MBV8825509.1 hypothetical protein [Hyphomicrobiales bacterium]MBV9429435.1 hypothetical protein [Bradyrhizobiaceae bacterium]MBV9728103.1 hypothetical protein [Pseudonocardiales bacterium]
MRTQTLSRATGLPVVLPLARYSGNTWHAAEDRADVSAGGAEDWPLDVLSDLATYGVVAGLAEIGRNRCLLPPAARLEPGFGSPRLREDRAAPGIGGDALRIEFVETGSGASADAPNYAVAAWARSAAARLRLPFVNTSLLTLVACADRLPEGSVMVPLAKTDKAAFLDQLKPDVRAAVAAREAVLRERRRLALRLPRGVADGTLDRQIEARLVFPMVQFYLESCLGPPGARFHLCHGEQAEASRSHTIAVGKFEASEPLGENIFALAMRRLFYVNPKTAVRRSFQVAPFALGRRIARHGAQTMRGAGEAMLAALQMEFLQTHSHRTASGLRPPSVTARDIASPS